MDGRQESDMTCHCLRIAVLGPLLLLAGAPARAQNSDDNQAKLAQYTQARSAYDEVASVYWDQIADKRRTRNNKRRINAPVGIDDYVLTQPPVYSGPPRPVDPNAPPGPPPGEKAPIPVLTDFLQ